MEARRRVLRDADLIPPLPEVIVRVIAALNDENTKLEELEKLLRCDPVLVARMLAMVNSPWYGIRRPVRTVKDAIVLLGYQNLRSMVMITSTSKFMRQDFSCYGHDDKGLWRHSVAVAAAARELALMLGEGETAAEELFVAALLHDIGKMVLSKYLAETPPDEIQSYDSITAAEQEILGMTHAEAGDLVAGKWNLTSVVHSVIANHHEDAVEVLNSRHVAIVRLSDALGHELGTGYQEGAAPAADYRQDDLACLGLDMDQWVEAKDRLRETMELATACIANVYS